MASTCHIYRPPPVDRWVSQAHGKMLIIKTQQPVTSETTLCRIDTWCLNSSSQCVIFIVTKAWRGKEGSRQNGTAEIWTELPTASKLYFDKTLYAAFHSTGFSAEGKWISASIVVLSRGEMNFCIHSWGTRIYQSVAEHLIQRGSFTLRQFRDKLQNTEAQPQNCEWTQALLLRQICGTSPRNIYLHKMITPTAQHSKHNFALIITLATWITVEGRCPVSAVQDCSES